MTKEEQNAVKYLSSIKVGPEFDIRSEIANREIVLHLIVEQEKKIKELEHKYQLLDGYKSEEFIKMLCDAIGPHMIADQHIKNKLEFYGLKDKDYYNTSTKDAYNFIGEIREMVGIKDDEEE